MTVERLNLLEFEQLLNKYSGKRYHIRQDEVAAIQDERFSLFEIIKMGKEKKIIGGLDGVKMLNYLERHLKVKLQ